MKGLTLFKGKITKYYGTPLKASQEPLGLKRQRLCERFLNKCRFKIVQIISGRVHGYMLGKNSLNLFLRKQVVPIQVWSTRNRGW